VLKIFCRFIILTTLNFFVIIYSSDIDIDQFLEDLTFISNIQDYDKIIIYIIISIIVSVLTGMLIYIFKPFTEIYLLYLWKFNFYFLINLVSISTTYIVFRIYGYSRLFLLVYLFTASFVLYITDKIK